jgi:hypothetical protein
MYNIYVKSEILNLSELVLRQRNQLAQFRVGLAHDSSCPHARVSSPATCPSSSSFTGFASHHPRLLLLLLWHPPPLLIGCVSDGTTTAPEPPLASARPPIPNNPKP